MAKSRKERKRFAENPLAVIVSLFGVMELAFTYPVTVLSGPNQTLFVHFMVEFPILVSVGFFLILWFKPGHLYAPGEYGNSTDFLRGIGKVSAIPNQETAGLPEMKRAQLPIDNQDENKRAIEYSVSFEELPSRTNIREPRAGITDDPREFGSEPPKGGV